MAQDQDFPLPTLAPDLEISRAPDAGGDPHWTIHQPASNLFYKIDWIAFEILSRFPAHRAADSLIAAVNGETTLRITRDDVAEIVAFLHKNALVTIGDQKIKTEEKAPKPLWKTVLHGYLYMTVPLFRPQSFLRKTYPLVAPVFSKVFVVSMLFFLGVMIALTIPRWDEFTHSFAQLFSFEGAIQVFLVLSFVKIVHEFAHAYTATRYGVAVPHMGVAFIVMYPILYTETSASWKLSSRRARFHIGMAGIVAELCLAALFLLLWHLSPSGSAAQIFSFLVVAVSLVSSLLVNLNPLMKFDGYYMFSDLTGIDNLQSRACAFARWNLRRILFGLKDPPPEDVADQLKSLLVTFGTALLVYRFFLFMGIAILVYHVFFQPLGLILMIVEVLWFIALPVWAELRVWWQKLEQIIASPRSILPAAAIAIMAAIVFVPWSSTRTIPAMLHAEKQFAAYAPAPSDIVSIEIADAQNVKEGDTLMVLESPALEQKIELAQAELDKLETLRRRAVSNPAMYIDNAISEAAIEKARVKVSSLTAQRDRLVVRAPFAGIVRDLDPELRAGLSIGVHERLFTLVGPEGALITAYANEGERDEIVSGAAAEFVFANEFSGLVRARISSVADAGQDDLPWPDLASLHGGPILSDKGEEGRIATRRAVYEIAARPSEAAGQNTALARRGYLRVTVSHKSIFSRFINELISGVRREGILG